MTNPPVHETWQGFFHGTVNPQRGGWQFADPIEIAFDDGLWAISIRHGLFQAIVNRGQPPDDPATFLNEVVSIIQGAVDSLGFHLGAVLTAELIGGWAPPNHLFVRELSWPAAVGRTPGMAIEVAASDLEPFVMLSTQYPLFRLALADHALALGRPDDTYFHAHRAVETVRQHFVEEHDGGRPEPSWVRLREELKIGRDELQPLSDASVSRRHGALDNPTETQRLEAIGIARRVIFAFRDHLLEAGPS